jgi:hypothetical protein
MKSRKKKKERKSVNGVLQILKASMKLCILACPPKHTS